MDIQIEETGNVTVVRLSGILAGDAKALLEEQVTPLFATERNLLLDLSAADFLSAEGLRLLLELYRQSQTKNVRLILSGLSRELQDILSMTGLMVSSLSMFETLEAGLDEINTQKPLCRRIRRYHVRRISLRSRSCFFPTCGG